MKRFEFVYLPQLIVLKCDTRLFNLLKSLSISSEVESNLCNVGGSQERVKCSGRFSL